MPRKECPIVKKARDRIEAEYLKNPDYTFSVDTFLDIAPDLKSRQKLRVMFCNHSIRKEHTNSLKIVGKKKGAYGMKVTLYKVKFLPIAAVNQYSRVEGGKPKRQSKEQEEVFKPMPNWLQMLESVIMNLDGMKYTPEYRCRLHDYINLREI